MNTSTATVHVTTDTPDQGAAPDGTMMVCLRMPAALVREIDEFAGRHAERAPGSVVSRNAAARFLLTQALRAGKAQP